MAGYDNISGKGFDSRTAEERRELAIKAGKASGEARRRKADFRRTLNMLLTTEIDNPEWTDILKAMGLDSTLESALCAAVIKRGMKTGDPKCFDIIARYAGQSVQTEADDEEQQIRTDRAKRARDLEVGDTDNSDGIQSFLKAMRPTEEELDSLFADQGEEEDNAEEAAETGDI